MLEQGYWIMPNKVLYSKELTDKQKLLFCAISSLCAEKGYCRATNEYLWEMFWVHKITISKNLSALQELWFIEIEIDWEWRKISISENAKGVSKNAKGGLAKTLSPYIYNNITIEYIYEKFYWATKWIDEKKCNKLIDDKLKQWVTLDDIHIWMVLYNTECRTSIEWKYVKKFETWITEFQPLTEEQVEETLARLIGEYKKKKQSDEKYSKSKPCKDVWTELCETFWKERINTLFKQADANKVLLHLT